MTSFCRLQSTERTCLFATLEMGLSRNPVCAHHKILFGWSNYEELDGRGLWYEMRRRQLQKGFWRGYLKESESPRRRWEDNTKMGLILDWSAWSALMRHTIGSSDTLMWKLPNLWFSQNVENLMASWTISLSKRALLDGVNYSRNTHSDLVSRWPPFTPVFSYLQ
jgi:hypothetical protein